MGAKKVLAVLALSTLALLGLSAPATADVGDHASGAGTLPEGWGGHCYDGEEATFQFDATGATEEQATGTFTFTCPRPENGSYPGWVITGTVSCLRVWDDAEVARFDPELGEVATVGGTVTSSQNYIAVGSALHFLVSDGGLDAADDRMSVLFSRADCSANSNGNTPQYPLTAGNIVIVDAPDLPPAPGCSDGSDNDGDALSDYPADPGCESAADETEAPDPAPPAPAPATKEDCAKGGYADYGFKNQGACTASFGGKKS